MSPQEAAERLAHDCSGCGHAVREMPPEVSSVVWCAHFNSYRSRAVERGCPKFIHAEPKEVSHAQTLS